MPTYAQREDVLRVLGGTKETLQRFFGTRLWKAGGPATMVTVDGLEVEVPDSILTRVDAELEHADSRVDAYVLKAYEARPTTVPAHLRSATAKLAALDCITTDGARTKYLEQMANETRSYLKDLAAAKLDLGIEAPRPKMRRPAAYFGGSRRGSGCV